jgi:hypothetical protein
VSPRPTGEADIILDEGTINKHIVANIVRLGDIQPYLDAGLNESWLRSNATGSYAIFETTSVTRQAYPWILEHYGKHGVVPSEDLFRLAFPAASFRFPKQDYRPSELIEKAGECIRSLLTSNLVGELIELHEQHQLGDLGKVKELLGEYEQQINVADRGIGPTVHGSRLTPGRGWTATASSWRPSGAHQPDANTLVSLSTGRTRTVSKVTGPTSWSAGHLRVAVSTVRGEPRRGD